MRQNTIDLSQARIDEEKEGTMRLMSRSRTNADFGSGKPSPLPFFLEKRVAGDKRLDFGFDKTLDQKKEEPLHQQVSHSVLRGDFVIDFAAKSHMADTQQASNNLKTHKSGYSNMRAWSRRF